MIRDEILWSAVQYEEEGNFIEFRKFDFDRKKEILDLIRQNNIKEINNIIKKFELGLNSKFNLNFIIVIDIIFLERYRQVYEKMKIGFLEYIADLWNFLAEMYNEKRIEIYNEPLFFNFTRKFLIDNKNFDALEFKNVITKLLPPQNVVFSFFQDNTTISFAILTTPYKFVFTFLDSSEIQELFKKAKKKKRPPSETMENFAKRLHKNYRVFYNERYLKISAAFVMKLEIIDYIKDVIEKYNFKRFLMKFAEYIKNTDTLWTSDGKIVLFRRWGKTFLGFDIEKLNPSSILNFNSAIKFLYGYQSRALMFIFDQDVKLHVILGLDLLKGSLRRFFIIPLNTVNQIFEQEKNVEKALLMAKDSLSEQLGMWVNTIIGVRYTDLNKFSAILSLGTSIGGALKFLKMIDNFIKYEMLIMPINPLLDVMKKEGSVKTIKKLYFPLILQG